MRQRLSGFGRPRVRCRCRQWRASVNQSQPRYLERACWTSSIQRHQSRRARQHLSIAAPVFHHGKGGTLNLSQKARSFAGLITSCAAVNHGCPTEYSRLQSRALSSPECLTVRVIHGEAAHGFSTAGVLGRGLLRFLLAVLLQPGAALRDGGGQAHGHHDVVIQRLHLQAVLLVRCDDGHHG